MSIIYQGPHTYVSTKFYKNQNIPTWNYLALHAYGTAEAIENNADIKSALFDLTIHAEKLWPSGWEFELPADLNEHNLNQHILAFKINLTHFDFKKKLSQNRS